MSRRVRARVRGDEGASVVEFTMLLPVLMLFTFGLVQGGLLYTANTVAQAAAHHGVAVGSTLGATPEQAEQAAQAYLVDAGRGLLGQPGSVTATRTGDLITVTVTGTPPSLVGIGLGQVRQQAAAAVEETL